MTDQSRRKVLTGVAGSVSAALAGCLGGTESSTSNQSTTAANGNSPTVESGTFDSIAFEGTDLVVSLTENADIGKVNMINAKGEGVTSRRVSTGASQVTFSYSHGSIDKSVIFSGERTFVGVRDGEEVDSVTKTFEPDVKLLNVQTKASAEGYTDPEANSEAFTQLVVEIANEGNAPVALEVDAEGTPSVFTTKGTPKVSNDARPISGHTLLNGGSTMTTIAKTSAYSSGAEPVLEFEVNDATGELRHANEQFTGSEKQFPDDYATGTEYEFEVVWGFDPSGSEFIPYTLSGTVTYSGGLIELPDGKYTYLYAPKTVELTNGQ